MSLVDLGLTFATTLEDSRHLWRDLGTPAESGSPVGLWGLALAGFLYVLNIPLSYPYLALLVTMITIAFKTVAGWFAPTTAIADAFR